MCAREAWRMRARDAWPRALVSATCGPIRNGRPWPFSHFTSCSPLSRYNIVFTLTTVTLRIATRRYCFRPERRRQAGHPFRLTLSRGRKSLLRSPDLTIWTVWSISSSPVAVIDRCIRFLPNESPNQLESGEVSTCDAKADAYLDFISWRASINLVSGVYKANQTASQPYGARARIKRLLRDQTPSLSKRKPALAENVVERRIRPRQP